MIEALPSQPRRKVLLSGRKDTGGGSLEARGGACLEHSEINVLENLLWDKSQRKAE